MAPLLVLLPFVVGQGETDYNAIAFLTAKVKCFRHLFLFLTLLLVTLGRTYSLFSLSPFQYTNTELCYQRQR